LGAGLFEGFAFFVLLVVQEKDVVAILALHGVGDLALGEREQRLFEVERPDTALDPAQFAARADRAGILGFLARQFGELRGFRARPGRQVLGLGQGLLLGLVGGAGRQLDQDVAGIDPGRHHVAGLVLFVVFL